MRHRVTTAITITAAFGRPVAGSDPATERRKSGLFQVGAASARARRPFRNRDAWSVTKIRPDIASASTPTCDTERRPCSADRPSRALKRCPRYLGSSGVLGCRGVSVAVVVAGIRCCVGRAPGQPKGGQGQMSKWPLKRAQHRNPDRPQVPATDTIIITGAPPGRAPKTQAHPPSLLRTRTLT